MLGQTGDTFEDFPTSLSLKILVLLPSGLSSMNQETKVSQSAPDLSQIAPCRKLPWFTLNAGLWINRYQSDFL